ncbi:unnamed protein product, partial [Symbiodinium necroappetens]
AMVFAGSSACCSSLHSTDCSSGDGAPSSLGATGRQREQPGAALDHRPSPGLGSGSLTWDAHSVGAPLGCTFGQRRRGHLAAPRGTRA